MVIVFGGLSTSCGAPDEDLRQALEQTRASVHTVQLALGSLDRQRSTRALAEVAASDAADEIASAQRTAGEVSAPSADARAVRAQVLSAIDASRIVVLDAADVLAEDADTQQLEPQLARVDVTLSEALSTLGTR